MTEVMAAPIHLDVCYQPESPPRCRSPQSAYAGPTGSYVDSLSNSEYDPYDSHKSSPPPSSVSSSSPFSSIASQSSVPSSVASSVCLDTISIDNDDQFLFPVYDQSAVSYCPDEYDYTSEDYNTPVPGTSPRSPSPPTIPEIPEIIFVPADDSVVRHEPSRHVDYLSHDWKEEDIWASWRYMVGKRKVYSNAARLENASWRTWAKAKFKLKTVSPETLNWLKDCDVTWLYGPLSTSNQKASLMVSPSSPTVSPTEPRIPSSGSFYVKKPILKKRSMSEVMLQKSLSSSSLLKQAAAAIESQQVEMDCKTSRPAMVARANSDFAALSYASKTTTAINTSELPSALSTGCPSPSYTKHIHFNDQVQQCIAVDKDDEDDEEDEDEEEDEVFQVENLEDSSSDNDDGLLMMPRPKVAIKSTTRTNSSEHQTIAMLPSTTLKYVEEPVIRKNDTFNNIGTFISSFATPAPTQPQDLDQSSLVGTKSYILEDDDDDMAELGWEPSGGVFRSRRDNVAVAHDRFGRADVDMGSTHRDDFELPKYTYEEDEDDEVAAGLFGRAVDAVNTARDIAHVLWNVGWRK
ncbi:hypothetical protein HOY80DRAFT_1009235 [Tuber brumale]|nr:hypothetical protein HOY80DRAFT_1009235 [Tuber brumale]